ncbi:flavoprotein [Acinetobacter sp. 1125_18A]|uniref:flavoprotein n=1 Tax=Acinetobacter sp. 1125_18A TaxID=2605959 RepID=UPI004059CEBE
MLDRKKSQNEGFFQNQPEFLKHYKGKIIASAEIKLTDFTGLNVAIIGANQLTVTHLGHVLNSAEFVKVFQITPAFILPQTEKGVQKLISHPLIIKNRRLFNHRVKSMLAIRYLESQVQEQWLKRQLMPNSALKSKVFLKSDTYYTALQRKNCKLITWPVVKITENAVQSMEGIEHLVDVIITTYE